jgi:uncharacterized SAM-binding protein YcdF (DUF218 family)
MMLFARVFLSLLLPPASLLLIVFIGALLIRTRYKKTGKALVIAGIAMLYLLSTSPVSNLLIRPLENDYPPLKGSVTEAAAVVVLTSGIKDLSHFGLGVVSGSGSLMRLVEGIKLYRENKGMQYIVVGGRGDPARPHVSFGQVLGTEAVSLGVAEDDLLIEDESMNTYEGALNLSKIFKNRSNRKIVLVTSAFHMPRSVQLYKETGFDVIPAPTDFKSEGVVFGFNLLIPTAGDLSRSSVAMYEYISSSWYILKGLFT